MPNIGPKNVFIGRESFIEPQKTASAETVRAFASSFLSSFRRADLGKPCNEPTRCVEIVKMTSAAKSFPVHKNQAATALCPSILADCMANERKAELTNCGTLGNCQSQVKDPLSAVSKMRANKWGWYAYFLGSMQ